MSEHSKYGPGSYAAVRAARDVPTASEKAAVFEREALKRSTIMCRDADCCLMQEELAQEEFEQDRKARGTLAIIIYVIVVIVIALAFSIGHHNGLIP